MAKNSKVTLVNLTTNPPSQGGLLYNKFLYATVTIQDPAGKALKRLSLVKIRGDLSFTGTPNQDIGNAAVKGTVTLYTNLSGYDKTTSLLNQIQEAVDNANTAKNGSTISPVKMEISCGYLGMISTPYTFSGQVFRITAERNMGLKSQAWKFEFTEANIYNNTVSLFSAKPTKAYRAAGVKYKEGDTEKTQEKGDTYLQILKDIYTPVSATLSFLDDPSFPLTLSSGLVEILNTEIIAVEDSKGNIDAKLSTYNQDYAEYNGKAAKGTDPFMKLARDFWVNVQKKLKQPNNFLCVTYKPDANGVTKAVLGLTTELLTQKTYAYLDDSKLLGAPTIAASYIEVETVFDPSVFYRDGVVIKSRYFNILTLSADKTQLPAEAGSAIINRDLNQEDKELEVLSWYIISYTINFSNVNSTPATMILSLSTDPLFYKNG